MSRRFCRCRRAWVDDRHHADVGGIGGGGDACSCGGVRSAPVRGRPVGFLSTPNPTATINDDGTPAERTRGPDRHPGGSEGGVLSLARRYPDLVVVNGKRPTRLGKRQAGARVVNGAGRNPGWRTVFAIARTSPSTAAAHRAIADRIGIPLDDLRAAMPAPRHARVPHADRVGSSDQAALCDGRWRRTRGTAESGPAGARDTTIDEQADQLISLGGVMSDRWAAQQSGVNRPAGPADGVLHPAPDMQALGYEPATANEATVSVVIPQDTTVLTSAEGCCTDDFITAHVLYEDSWVARTRMR